MRKKSLLFFIWLTIQCCAGYTQDNKNIDSLINILQKQKEDTNKVKILNELSKKILALKNIRDSKKYAEDAVQLAEKINFNKGIEEAYKNLGNSYIRQGAVYYYQGNYPEASKYYLEALRRYEKVNAKKGIANVYRNIGLVYWVQGSYSEALKNHSTSLKLFEELADSVNIAAGYNDLGNVYENSGNIIEALKNYQISLHLYDQLGDKEKMMNRYFNIGFLHDNQGNYPDALKNFLSAKKLSEEIGSEEGVAASYVNIGDMYYHQSKTEPQLKEQLLNEALKVYLISFKVYKKLAYNEELAICYNAMGRIYFELKQFSKARQYLNNGLLLFTNAERNENSGEYYQLPVQYIAENHSLLEKLDSASGNWKGAYTHHKLYIFYKDSLVKEENLNKLLKTQMEYDFGKKADSLKFQQQLSDEKLREQTLLTKGQKKIKNYILTGSILLCILGFFAYKNYRTRQKLKLQELRNKIAIDLHDDIGSTLSSISIFSQMAQQESKEAIPLLETIGENSRKMLDAMADIVWTINPENDQFEKIVLRMRSFAFELLGAKKIDFEFNADEDVVKMKLSMDVRKNLYLIFKEATNNLVKYSGADKALFTIKGEKNGLIMLIHDNGKGFDTKQSTNGNGLRNMKKRAEEIGAQFMIDSKPGIGTTIELKLAV